MSEEMRMSPDSRQNLNHMLIEALEQSVDDMLDEGEANGTVMPYSTRSHLRSKLKKEIRLQSEDDFVSILKNWVIKQPGHEIDGPAFQAHPFLSMCDAVV